MRPPVTERILRLGTRGSKLARWQADWTTDRLRELGVEVEVIEITTQGDAQQGPAVGELGSTGVFTKEIQQALLDQTIDLAVHSLKDLPTTPVPGLRLAAVPMREVVNDAFVLSQSGSDHGSTISDLPNGARVGTGSLRRQSQILRLRPDLQLLDIRGNVDTRLRKLDAGDYDAILLAAAGLTRLGLAGRITQLLPTDLILPAPGQGALGLECRADDSATAATIASLNHAETLARVTAERTMLARVEGGCLAAIGADSRIEGEQLYLSAVVLSFDGSERLFAEGTSALSDSAKLGNRLGDELLSQGAARLIRARP